MSSNQGQMCLNLLRSNQMCLHLLSLLRSKFFCLLGTASQCSSCSLTLVILPTAGICSGSIQPAPAPSPSLCGYFVAVAYLQHSKAVAEYILWSWQKTGGSVNPDYQVYFIYLAVSKYRLIFHHWPWHPHIVQSSWCAISIELKSGRNNVHHIIADAKADESRIYVILAIELPQMQCECCFTFWNGDKQGLTKWWPLH